MQDENRTSRTPVSNNLMDKQTDIKAVFFDVDGTLISFKTHEIPHSAISAIRKLQQKGIKVIVATGRSMDAVKPIRHLHFDGFVTFNGSYCADKDGNILFRKTIDPKSIHRLLDYSENHPLNFVLMYEDRILANEISPLIDKIQANLNLPVPPLLDPKQVDASSVLQANIFIRPEEEPEFMQTIMPDCTAARWTPLFADVNPGGISKKVGVEVFCRHFGIDAAETMSFGDGGNDMAMLQYTGIGVAMGNAGPEVKAVADYVTTDSEQDGISKALEHFGILSTSSAD